MYTLKFFNRNFFFSSLRFLASLPNSLEKIYATKNDIEIENKSNNLKTRAQKKNWNISRWKIYSGNSSNKLVRRIVGKTVGGVVTFGLLSFPHLRW